MAPAATGTDTGGSIRQPASYCNLTGLKPTYGRISRYGMIAFSSSLDQAGPITKTVEDSALMLQVMAGHDTKDATSKPEKVPDYLSACYNEVTNMKIGIPDLEINNYEVINYFLLNILLNLYVNLLLNEIALFIKIKQAHDACLPRHAK